jgi:hypothetical protein
MVASIAGVQSPLNQVFKGTMYHIVKWGRWSVVLMDTLFCLEDDSSLGTVDTCCEWNNKNIYLCDFKPYIFICKHHKQNATPQDLSLSIYYNKPNHLKYLFRQIQEKHIQNHICPN